jgi:hypothetical protein
MQVRVQFRWSIGSNLEPQNFCIIFVKKQFKYYLVNCSRSSNISDVHGPASGCGPGQRSWKAKASGSSPSSGLPHCKLATQCDNRPSLMGQRVPAGGLFRMEWPVCVHAPIWHGLDSPTIFGLIPGGRWWGNYVPTSSQLTGRANMVTIHMDQPVLYILGLNRLAGKCFVYISILNGPASVLPWYRFPSQTNWPAWAFCHLIWTGWWYVVICISISNQLACMGILSSYID